MELHLGDSRDILPTFEERSFDAICTDPPYEIGMMGRAWDKTGIAFDPAFWVLCLHVLKPGGHLVAFGAPNTHHRIWCAIEDAGFEIRDTLQWLRGRGYPKSRASLKPCSEPILLARRPLEGKLDDNEQIHGTGALNIEGCRVGTSKQIPASPRKVPHSRRAFGEMGSGVDGTGFDASLGRYPSNVVLSHLPECERVGTRRVKTGTASPKSQGVDSKYFGGTGTKPRGFEMGYGEKDGREQMEDWNCAPGCAVAALDAQSGLTGQKAAVTGREPSSDGFGRRVYDSTKQRSPAVPHDELGSASRFFPVFEDDASFRYVRRAGTSERSAGCDDFFWRRVGTFWERVDRETWVALAEEDRAQGNVHPTLKPIALLRWLVRLICPVDGTVLDPFLGSGSTALACLQEKLSCVGIERDPENYAMARGRVEWVTGAPIPEHGDGLPDRPEKRQGNLFT